MHLNTFPKFVWLIIPGLVFIVLLGIFVLRMSRPEANSTDTPAPTPTTYIFPTPTTQAGTPLQSLVGQIRTLQIDDAQTASPIFDDKISLPEE